MRRCLGLLLALAALAPGCGGGDSDPAPPPAPPPPPVVFHDVTVRIPEGDEGRYPFTLGEERTVKLDLESNREVDAVAIADVPCDRRVFPGPSPRASWGDVLVVHYAARLPAGEYCLEVRAPSSWQWWRTTRVTLKLMAE
jgi:hypothetical protein